ncbi:MAG: PEP-CTERM-box response regulator transcription factor [Candidatus Omnitrophica bacterium]|nr:PEP-CTERM-box response regulator transcription factor [Candidatus Omnitrophota bacterium]
MKAKLLIVDDDLGLLKQLKWALESDYEVVTSDNYHEALRLLREFKPELVILDINLNGLVNTSKDGIELLDRIKSSSPFTKVIMVTGNSSKDLALESISKGAFDYYLKPVNIEELKILLRRAFYIQGLELENQRLTDEIERKFKFEEMVGTSPKMEDIFRLIRKVATTDATVLVTGESGTGKELVANAVHYLSSRRGNPFIVINCGAIPENLLESELFGHEKGAFTDAYARKIGKLEVANRGTVLLDEIGEMSLNLQVKILRFLQERIIERVGGNTPIELDVRVIAATNSDLKKKIEENKFREDLYYRLSVINIDLPPLRERGEDILLLANYFLNKYKKDVPNKEIKGFTKEARDAMVSFSWPGNVREMENRIRRALILADSPFITPLELGLVKDNGEDDYFGKFSLKDARQYIEIKFIKRAIGESKGNLSLAAKMLGVSRPTLYDLMKKYKISSE